MHKGFHLMQRILCSLDIPINYSEDCGTKVLVPTQQVCLVLWDVAFLDDSAVSVPHVAL